MKAPYSASSLGRVMACSGTQVLPQDHNPETVWSLRGTAIHSMVEAHTLGARWEDSRARGPLDISDAECRAILDCWDDVRKTYSLEVIPMVPLAEIAMALNPMSETVRFLGANIGRRYECETGEIPGTADYFLRSRGVPMVLDIKTGSPRHAPKPQEAWQLRHNAICLWLWQDRPPLVAQSIWAVKEGPVLRTYAATAAELYGWMQEVADRQQVLDAVRAGQIEPEYVKHSGCHWCPSRPYCPAWSAIKK